MKFDSLSLIRELSLLFGPTGCEDRVADRIEELVAPLCTSYCRDKMGNLLCLVRTGDPTAENRRRIMLSAHMDEVGLMVNEVCDNGMLRFGTVGGINVSVLEGRKVTLLANDGSLICGVVASKAIHHRKRDEVDKPSEISKLYIDIGAEDREDALRLVRVGTLATFDSEFYTFGKDGAYVKSKALDDRMGCAALIEIMGSLKDAPIQENFDLYFCFTVREEIGLSGAKVAAQKIAPELAIVLETTAIADLPDVEPCRRVADVGKGGVLSVMDRGTIYNRDFLNFALGVSEEKKIPAQLKRYVSGGNDAGHIHKSGAGVRCLALSVATRYLHSPSCVASMDDYRSVRDLTEAMLRAADAVRP